MERIKRPARALLALLVFGYSSLGIAQAGWAVSELVTAPRTDYPVTGPPPYRCLSDEEEARLRRDPVHRFQVWLARWLEETFDRVTRMQTHASCARVCAAIPLGAQAITDLRGYARLLPDGPFGAPEHAEWEAEIDTSQVVGDKRLVCTRLHTHWYFDDVEGYFIVYYER